MPTIGRAAFAYHKKVVFDKQANWLPREVTGFRGAENPKLSSRLRTTWKRLDELWLPTKFEGVVVTPSYETEFTYTLQFVVGDKLPADWIDPEADCWLEKLAPLFGGTASAGPFTVEIPIPKVEVDKK